MDRYDMEDTYKKWWKGKLCRVCLSSNKEFKRVLNLKYTAPPSGIYGVVEFEYYDGTNEHITPLKIDAYRPRKCDVEVKEE